MLMKLHWILLLFLYMKQFTALNIVNALSSQRYVGIASLQAMVNQFKLWGFWVAGLDTVKTGGDYIVISKLRGLPCGSVKGRLALPLVYRLFLPFDSSLPLISLLYL